MPMQPAPSAQRAIDIITLLAEQPRESFPVAEIARRVGQTRATCQAVLLALEAPAWVHRTDSGGYALGSGLIGVGMAAQQGSGVTALLGRTVKALHAETHCEASGAIPSGPNLIVVARSGPSHPLTVAIPLGQVFPLIPPFGLAFAVWGEGTFDEWLSRAPQLTKAGRGHLAKAAGIARDLGYSVNLDTGTRQELTALRRTAEVRRVLELDEELAMRSGVSLRVQASHVSAPVLTPDGRAIAEIGVLLGGSDPEEFMAAAAAVKVAAARASQELDSASSATYVA